MGANIFTLVLGLAIATFFAWTGNNGRRRDREIELGIYAWKKEERAVFKAPNMKTAPKLSEHPKNIEYSRQGKQFRPLFGPFVYRDDRRLSSNRRAPRNPC